MKPTAHNAYILSLVSLVLTVIAAVCGIAVAAAADSAALLAFGLENLVDSFSSVLVLWRFWGGGVGKVASELELETREKRASVGIAFSFLILAFVVGGVAAAHLSSNEQPDQLKLLLALSVPCVFIFSILGGLKYRMGSALDSPSLKKDGICSISGALMSASTALGAIMLLDGIDSWWFDSSVAIIICTILFLYGSWTLYKNASTRDPVTGAWNPERWWTLEWWNTSGSLRQGHQRGDDEPEDEESSVPRGQLNPTSVSDSSL